MHRKQHQINPVIKETVDVKCCAFKVSKYRMKRFFMTSVYIGPILASRAANTVDNELPCNNLYVSKL